MAKMITLSFKDNEMELYQYVKSKSSPSIYIKDLISKEISGGVTCDGKKDKDRDEDNTKETKSTSINLSALKSMGR